MSFWRDLSKSGGTPVLNETVSDILTGSGVPWNGAVESLTHIYGMLAVFCEASDDRKINYLYGSIEDAYNRQKYTPSSSANLDGIDDSDLLADGPWGGAPPPQWTPYQPNAPNVGENVGENTDYLLARTTVPYQSDAARRAEAEARRAYESWGGAPLQSTPYQANTPDVGENTDYLMARTAVPYQSALKAEAEARRAYERHARRATRRTAERGARSIAEWQGRFAARDRFSSEDYRYGGTEPPPRFTAFLSGLSKSDLKRIVMLLMVVLPTLFGISTVRQDRATNEQRVPGYIRKQEGAPRAEQQAPQDDSFAANSEEWQQRNIYTREQEGAPRDVFPEMDQQQKSGVMTTGQRQQPHDEVHVVADANASKWDGLIGKG